MYVLKKNEMCVLHVQEVVLKTRGVRSTVDAGSKQVSALFLDNRGVIIRFRTKVASHSSTISGGHVLPVVFFIVTVATHPGH